jgi:hypothetical protein
MTALPNPIPERPIEHPSAWLGSEIGGKEGLTHRMGPEHVAALHELLGRTRRLKTTEITRRDFDHPLVNELMAAARYEIMHGKGAVILAGLDVSGLPLEDYERLYWGLGTHLGTAAIQSPKQDLIGYVQKVEDNPDKRGYQLDVELRSHTDFHEILSLACVRKSASGGRSGAVSALAVHEILKREAPEALKVLYQGWRHGFAGPEHLTADNVPVFCNVGGVVSCYYHLLSFLAAARVLETEVPQALRDAMAAYSAVAQRPEVRADFMLEPGEMLFWHNFVVLHSREAFADTPEQKRLLLRLWLHVEEDGRPMHPEYLKRARLMDELHAQGLTALQYRPFVKEKAAATQ